MSTGLMTQVTRDDAGIGTLPPPSEAMLGLLARIRGGAVLVTGDHKKGRRNQMMCELVERPDDSECEPEAVPVMAVRGLIRRGLVAVVSRTKGTCTWGSA